MHVTEPQDACAACGSWKLTPLGIATETVAEHLSIAFPTAKIFIIDGDHGTHLSIQRTIQLWQETPASMLIATPMALPYLHTCPYGCIVSMDSLLSLPHYTASMRALTTATAFLEKISDRAIIQTRNYHHDVIQALEHDALYDYLEQERAMRKQFNYPPFCVIIKLVLEISSDRAKDAITYCETLFKVYDPDILVKKSRKPSYVMVQAVVRFDTRTWNTMDHDIHYVLKNMGPEWQIEINPESVL
jgi:primosomal protein N'